MKLSKIWSIIRTVTVCAALASTGMTIAYAGTPVIWPAVCTGLWMVLTIAAEMRRVGYKRDEQYADDAQHIAELIALSDAECEFYGKRLAATIGFDEFVKTEKSASAVVR